MLSITTIFIRKMKIKNLDLLERLKIINAEYLSSDNSRKTRIFDACEFLFRECEELGLSSNWDPGVGRAAGEAYVCFGDEFLLAEFGKTMADVIRSLDVVSS